MEEWWRGFFDDAYLKLWGASKMAAGTAEQVEGLWRVLGLVPGARVLDAPCGYGRTAAPLAERGAVVLGVDQSAELLAEAERGRGGLGEDRLRYLRADLRQPLEETGFDAGINIFTSLGYGTEEDDVAVLTTLRRAVRPGGRVFVETMHRDAAVAGLMTGRPPASRLPDGTLVVEQPEWDPVTGRIETCWYWAGPSGSGAKPASLRCYSITELVRLLERAGLRFVSAHRGCSPDRFDATAPGLAGRVGLLAVRD